MTRNMEEEEIRGELVATDEAQLTKHGSDKFNRAIEIISSNYSQINSDEEAERCKESIDILTQAAPMDAKDIIQEQVSYARPDLADILDEGEITGLHMEQGHSFFDDSIEYSIELSVHVPSR